MATITVAAVTTLFKFGEILHGPFIQALNSNDRHRLNRMTADIVIEQAVGRVWNREKRLKLFSPIGRHTRKNSAAACCP